MNQTAKLQPTITMAGEDVPGWYAYGDLHRRAVESAPAGSILVEVGVFCGKSLIGLAELARAADKGLRVVGVDTFEGSEEHKGFDDVPRWVLIRETLLHLENAGLKEFVSLIVADSVSASRLFADRSVWMVIIDAAHDEASVAADIEAWRPKIAPYGLLAGDDYIPEFPGVMAAVDRLVPNRVVPGCWWEKRIL